MDEQIVEMYGGCHCGAIRFSVKTTPNISALDCNCSICYMKGNLHFIVPSSKFRLLQGKDNVTVLQTIGVKGAIFPFSFPETVFPFPDPAQTEFDPISLKNGKVLLMISDYTLNTLFSVGRDSGNLWTRVKKGDNGTEVFPFAIDTEGLGMIVPELTAFFNDTFNCTLKVGVQGKHKQPIITTGENGSNLYVNFGIYIDVNNETSIFDDPFNAVNLDLEFNIELILDTEKDKMNIKFGTAKALTVTAESFIGPINPEKSKDTIESIMKIVIEKASPTLKDIDIIGAFNKYTGMNFYDFNITKGAQHHIATLNCKDAYDN